MSAKKKRPAQKKRSAKVADAVPSMAQLDAARRAGTDATAGLDILFGLIGPNKDRVIAGFAASILVNVLTNAVGRFQFVGPGSKSRIDAKIKVAGLTFNGPSVDFASFARKMDCWPVLYHARPQKRAETDEDMQALKLADDLRESLTGKPFSDRGPAYRAVQKIYKFAEDRRMNAGNQWGYLDSSINLSSEEQDSFHQVVAKKVETLPPLTREPAVLKKWRAAGRALLPFLYGKKFHKHPDLLPLIQSVTDEGYPKPLGKHFDKNNKPLLWDVNATIQKAISDAWKSFPKG